MSSPSTHSHKFAANSSGDGVDPWRQCEGDNGGGGGGGGPENSVNFTSSGGLGGGGGGAGVSKSIAQGGRGGSGVLIARYLGAPGIGTGGAATTGTGDATGYTIHTFTNTGANTLTFTYEAGSLEARQRGAITGTGGLTFNGSGSLTLAASNSFAGATRVAFG